MITPIKIIGAGLAGCEAAWQIASRGIAVELYEQKPVKMSPAHKSENYAELVCSNSLRADGISNAVGLLKEEMRMLGSLVMEAADSTRVPAGGALAVDRDGFSKYITDKVKSHPLIKVIEQEVTAIPQDGIVIVASGPLTEGELYEDIRRNTGDYLHFFDAAAPIVTLESIDNEKVYRAARYGKGGADYINCPMNKDEYERFYNELINAEEVQLHGFENNVFEGCMPVEIMAKRGPQTLLFGMLKPVGLPYPGTDKWPHAVVQLRQDNKEGTLFNLVGFQTHLKFGEQKRVFSMIPGLENAEFVRYGVMHRNTYINSPKLLDATYRMRDNERIYFAGQITGVEGYVESASSGIVAGINAAMSVLGKEQIIFDNLTATGALANYVSCGSQADFQPMNVNFGIIPSLEMRIRNKKEKNEIIANRAIKALENQLEGSDLK
ncbi:MAG: methylenetetrahydrofolate--tRNA-(uracil(54)-C(5))-methyltransferase (FADH(2)-oxidizing) TrmFO [Eubacteriales bacterium]|nr:methylenetetrahydrofolate--tRNA-(uracil(54)-C(5))-methyltransferase (FADH(2)-oxidizing) TrmFO [Eubacteriales bacterium]